MQDSTGWTRTAEPPRPDVVAVAQQLLRADGARHVVVDGRVDAATAAATCAFQDRYGLRVDGVPDGTVVAALRRVQAGGGPAPVVPARPVSPVVPVAPGAPIWPPAPVGPVPRFPLNRVVAFAGPYIAVLSGLVTAWAGRHFPGLQVDPGQTTLAITQAAEFALGAAITWGLHHKWLDGWSNWETAVIAAERAPS